LIGLQFVVVTLLADKPIPDMERTGNAFATPTVVYFWTVLLLSGVLSAPWNGVGRAAIAWGLIGFVGIIYAFVVARRMRAQTGYRPEFIDWLFNFILPLVGYAVLAGSAFFAAADAGSTLFAVGGAALLLLFVGIRNAWDAVTYHVFVTRQKPQNSERSSKRK
jgi:hypothetical protein